MARMTFEELNIALDTCIETGVIFNVDFQDMKSYAASRNLHADIDKVRAEFMHAGKYQERSAEEYALIDSLTDSIVQFPTKKCVNAHIALNSIDPNNAVAAKILELVEKWRPVGDKFRTLKPLIVKGRKPSTTPRITPERTLENTGTCSCCGNNVKLADNKIVSHGFTIRWGYQEGACIGVDYDPIEISTEGLLVLEGILKRTGVLKQELLIRLVRGDFDMNVNERNAAIYKVKREAKWIGQDLIRTLGAIENWKPATLPGDLMKQVAA